MLTLWKKNKFLFVFLLIIVFLFPSVISKESLTYSHLICIGMGIDKKESEYEISLQVIVPQQSSNFNETLKIVSGKGKTVNEAINAIKFQVGKDVGFSQCECIIFNEEVAKENILLPIDYFVRTHNLNYNCILVCTDKSANKILEINSSLGKSYSFDLSRILEYNETNLFSKDTNIEQAYRAFLSKNTAFAITLLSTSKDSSDGLEGELSSGGGGDSSSGKSSGGSQSSGGSSGKDEEKVLVNDTMIALFKNGKLIGKIKDDEINGIEFLNPHAKNLQIKIENYSDELYTNATIEFDIQNKFANTKCEIVGDKLVMKSDVLVYIKLDDILQKDNFDGLIETNTNYYTKGLIEEIKKTQIKMLNDSIEKLKELNIDLIDLYENFDRWKHVEFENYLSRLENKNDYFQNVIVEANFNIIGI